MKKRSIVIIMVLLVCVLSITGCGTKINKDATEFKKEYKEVAKDNVFVYKSTDEIISILQNGTGVIYLGFPDCKWCQAYVPMLDEIAKEVKVDEIYYLNIYDQRKGNTKNYQKIVSLLKGYLRFDENGKEKIYVPAVIAVKDGKIIGFDDETSYDTEEEKDPTKYWTKERKEAFKLRLTPIVGSVVDTVCTDCNK